MEAFIVIAVLVGLVWIIVGAVNWIRSFDGFQSDWSEYNLPQKVFFTFCCGPIAWVLAIIIRPLLHTLAYLFFDVYDDIMRYLGTLGKKE